MPATRSQTSRDCTIQASIVSCAPTLQRMDAKPFVLVSMHLGPSSEVVCTRGGKVRHGREVAGDLDIVPAHTPSAWELKQPAQILIVRVPEALLRDVAEGLQRGTPIAIADRFMLRDPVLEHLCWSIKAELEGRCATGPEFMDMMGRALATRLLRRHSARSLPMREVSSGISGAKVKAIVSYIEDNLSRELPLVDIARVANVSVSHLKSLFRQATGTPVHQYVVRRRIQRAASMLKDRRLTIADVASASGFAHQSHMARQMRKYLGATPTELRKQSD